MSVGRNLSSLAGAWAWSGSDTAQTAC